MPTSRRPDPHARRRRRLRKTLDASGVDALLVSTPENVRYLSGFTGEDSFLLVDGAGAVLLTDSRFAEQAKLDCPSVDAVLRDGPMADAAAAEAERRKVNRLALEKTHVTLAVHEKLSAALGADRLTALDGPVETMRATKDDEEAGAIGKAVRIAERAFRELTASGASGFVGRSEADLAGELEYRMRKLGASGASFPTIVAAGPHAALPHYRPGGTKVCDGDAVLIDWGAVWDGYCSDLTRVVFVGRIPPQLGRVYEVVLKAQAAGVKAVRAGRPASAVDKAARDVIVAAGFGENFGHGLGHGVGLDVHEGPAVSRRSKRRLRKGNVITVEPGVYLPGVGGVRIEDDVLVEADGGVVLSRLPKRMAAMILK